MEQTLAPEVAGLPTSLPGARGRVDELEEILEQLVRSLSPGERLPSERQLADRFGVARMTARQAVEALAGRGLVARRQGHGTFVTESKFVQPETLTSFTEDMLARGKEPSAQLLSQRLLHANSVVAARLQVAPGSGVVCIERLRSAGGEAIAVETAWLPASRFPGLESARLEGKSLYAYLEERWGVAVHVADQWAAAVRLPARHARLLGVSPGQAALQFLRVTRDAAMMPVEYVVSLYRGDRYELHMRLERRQLQRA